MKSKDLKAGYQQHPITFTREQVEKLTKQYAPKEVFRRLHGRNEALIGGAWYVITIKCDDRGCEICDPDSYEWRNE